MPNLSNIGRVFYGVAMAGIGFQTVFYHDFPYMMVPPHASLPGLAIIAYVFGVLLMLAGVCIAFGIKARPAGLWLGGVLVLVFCLCFIPYQIITNQLKVEEWENAAKELALAAGALVVAGCFAAKNESGPTRFLAKLLPLGAILYALTIISFGCDHFIYGKAAADYVPAWIPYHVFWIYFCGVPLVGAGLAIILKIRVRLFAFLLGAMIFTWFVILHIPYAIANPFGGMGGEVTSAWLALAYSGTALVVAGEAKK